MTFLLLAVLQDAPLEGDAARLYREAQSGKWFEKARKLNPEILPTSDGRSFFAVWTTVKEPERWIVSLHGSQGFATDDLALWEPHLKGREVGLICLQWWLGGDCYYLPLELYREIDRLLERRKVKPGAAMFHGFSRGSANSYAVVAIDHGRGRKYFSLAVASSGGVGVDFPLNQAVLRGEFGERPLNGTHWITVAGAKDQNSDRDGIAGMRRAGSWLKEQGAVLVDAIEDPDYGHGAFMLNPKNARRVLDQFLKP